MAKPVRHGGGWRIRWKGADGRRRSETFARFEDAKLALAKRRVEAEEERLGIRRATATPRTFDELCDEWMSTRGARKRSRKTDESFIRSHLLPAFGRLPIRQIDVGRVERFKAERSTLHPNTVNPREHEGPSGPNEVMNYREVSEYWLRRTFVIAWIGGRDRPDRTS